jgi:hypothetical protein
MKRTTIFEGYFDQNCGWEFDMPAFMVKPTLGYVEVGSGQAGIDQLVEEYLISRFMEQDESGKAIGTDKDFFCQIDEDIVRSTKIQFAFAKKGKARDGIFYWCRIVEWDDEDETYQKVIQDICVDKSKFA